MSERLFEVNTRLEEIEKLMKPLWAEFHKLEAEKASIINTVALEKAKNYSYNLVYNRDGFYKVRLECKDSKTLNKELYALGGTYHSSFNVGAGVTLNQDDGSIYFLFMDSLIYKKFIKTHKLSVDNSSFKKQILSLKNDIKILEDLTGE